MERDWWLRALLVLQRPGLVFAAMRSDADAEERQEPLLAIILLAGIAGVLMTNLASRVLDDYELDALSLSVWVFIAGAIYGVAAYFALGALVLVGERLAGSPGSYRRSRHVLAFACVPLVLTFLVVAVRVTAFGEDAFRSGGSDAGVGGTVIEALELAAIAWSAALLVVGVRTVNEWSWPRALAASTPALVPPALLLARAFGVV
ncbi:MAG TPA: Yip1 family protein [Gaiellaceae bacterium]|nr:Yip1 family protein [Gaiellaceae bacterium]